MYLREVFANDPTQTTYRQEFDKAVADPKYISAVNKLSKLNLKLRSVVNKNTDLKKFGIKLQDIQRKIETQADPRDIPLWGKVFMLTTAAVFLFNKVTSAFAAAVADKDADGDIDFDDYNDLNPSVIKTLFNQFDDITDAIQSPEWQNLDPNLQKDFLNLADAMKGKLQGVQGWYQMQGDQEGDKDRFDVEDMAQQEKELAIGKMFSQVFKFEGGFQNDATDQGNYTKSGKLVGTNHGISAYLYELVKGKEPTQEDMQNLTKAEAAEIYKTVFLNVIIGDAPNQLGVSATNPLAGLLLDMNVKEGQGRFTKILGSALGVQGGISQIKGELKTQFESDPAGTYDKIAKQYKKALNDRVDQMEKDGKNYEKYRKGWNNRTDTWINNNPFKQAA